MSLEDAKIYLETSRQLRIYKQRKDKNLYPVCRTCKTILYDESPKIKTKVLDCNQPDCSYNTKLF